MRGIDSRGQWASLEPWRGDTDTEERGGRVSLEVLTKILAVTIVFLLTKRFGAGATIVGCVIVTFVPDVVAAFIKRRRWDKRRVAVLASLIALVDQFYRQIIRALRRCPPFTRRMFTRIGEITRHWFQVRLALATSAAALTAVTMVIAVSALATGTSPFQQQHLTPGPTGTVGGGRGSGPMETLNIYVEDSFNTVQSSSAMPACNSTCRSKFPDGTQVVLTAIKGGGPFPTTWAGCVNAISSYVDTCNVVVHQNTGPLSRDRFARAYLGAAKLSPGRRSLETVPNQPVLRITENSPDSITETPHP